MSGWRQGDKEGGLHGPSVQNFVFHAASQASHFNAGFAIQIAYCLQVAYGPSRVAARDSTRQWKIQQKYPG